MLPYYLISMDYIKTKWNFQNEHLFNALFDYKKSKNGFQIKKNSNLKFVFILKLYEY